MKRKIFIRCFLIAFMSVLIVFVAGIGITYISNKHLVSERLITETKLTAALLDERSDFHALEIFNNNDECRVTIISLSGEVLFDSDTHEELENHIDREEVIAAISGTPQPIERYSDTFGCRMTYYAIKTQFSDGTEAILRLAIKSEETNAYILSAIPFLFVSLIISGIVAGIFANRLSKSVASRITDISTSLKSVSGGTYIPLETSVADSEFYTLYNEINDLNEKTVLHLQNEEGEREKLNSVLDNISQGIIALSNDMRIAFVNGSATKLFGKNENLTSKELSDLIEDKALLENIKDASNNDKARFEHHFGDKILVVEIIRPTGKILENEIRHILILSDITVEKELARQKEEFFANASHELKTPMTAMLGLSELLLARDTDESTHRQIERIHKESLRLSDLISDMLKLSRLENENTKQNETLIAVSVDAVAEEVLTELSETIKEKNITASITGKTTVLADEKRIYEILQNLCTNAVNYNKLGGYIEIILEDNENNSVIRVKDSGIGIAEENIPHLCERFYRVDKSRSKKTGGTGLGLAIVKHICALYGAEFIITSELEVGTEATVIFRKNN